jgi:NitT/TauT family transport system substrate-binding protein
MKRRTFTAALAGAAVFAVAGQKAMAADPVSGTITVTHWGGQFYGAPYAVAMDKGFFRNRGVDVTGVLTADGGGTAVRNTTAGDIPFGEVSLAAAVQAINAGQKLRIVSAGVQSVGDQAWAVKRGSSIHSLKDLAGKKIGYTSPGSVSNMVILMALKASGMTASQVKLVPAGDLGANLAAAANGSLDAGFTDEYQLDENKNLVQAAFLVRDVLNPQMMQTVCIVDTDYAKSHPDVVKALIAGRRDGLEFLKAHPDEAAAITGKAYSVEAAPIAKHFAELLPINYWSDGRFDYDAMNHMVEGLQIIGQLKGNPDWSTMVDSSFLPPDLRAAK